MKRRKFLLSGIKAAVVAALAPDLYISDTEACGDAWFIDTEGPFPFEPFRPGEIKALSGASKLLTEGNFPKVLWPGLNEKFLEAYRDT